MQLIKQAKTTNMEGKSQQWGVFFPRWKDPASKVKFQMVLQQLKSTTAYSEYK